MSGWTKAERQMIRDGMSWGDVWMVRNPEFLLKAAEKMVEEAEQRDAALEKEKSKKSKKDDDDETK